MRNLMSTLAGAVAIAILLKWACLAAFEIPSSSMQPTLIGDDASGVHDRVLVDTLALTRRDPERWELTVFRPPLDQKNLYVKRCIGLPGERLAIAGGNIHRLQTAAGTTSPAVLRRPEWLVEAMWRELHPARARVRGDRQVLGIAFRGEPARAWSESDSDLVVALPDGDVATLRWTDPDGGLVDRVWDGCPLEVARAVRSRYVEASLLGEIVPDARIAVRLEPEGALDRCSLSLEVHRPDLPLLRFALRVESGVGVLTASRDGDPDQLGSTPFDCPLPANTVTELTFTHIDDELVAQRQGVELARVDCSAFSCQEGCELPDPCGMGPALPTPGQQVALELTFEGSGRLRLRDLRVLRDQHWTRGALPPGEIIDVPEGHWFVLGDSPLQSTDSRGFAAFAIGELDGAAVAPTTPGARVLRGSLQLVPADWPPGRHENPIVHRRRDRLSLVDLHGEHHALRCDPALDLRDAKFAAPTARFIPRDSFVGRPLLRFWPLPPFGPWRAGRLR